MINKGLVGGSSNTIIARESNIQDAQFGEVLASAGDFNNDSIEDLILGAPNYDGNNSGRAFLYYGGPRGGSPGGDTTADLSTGGFDPNVQDKFFGRAIAAAEQGNQGYSSLFICQLDELQVFIGGTSPTTTIDDQQPCVGSGIGCSAGEGFCSSVAVNTDGTLVAVGSPLYDVPGDPDSGRVYLYRWDVPTSQLVAIDVKSGSSGGQLGTSLSFGGVPGNDVLFAGAPFAGSTDAGRVTWWPVSTSGFGTGTNIAGAQDYARFGAAVHGADFDGDGDRDLVVGEPFYDAGALNNRGRILLFPVTAASVAPIAFDTFAGTVAGMQAGFSLGSGDIDGNGTADVFFGAPYLTAPQTEEGAAQYIVTSKDGFELSSGSDEGGANYYHLGWSVAGLDFDNDRYFDAVFGVPGYTKPSSNEGRWVLRYGEW